MQIILPIIFIVLLIPYVAWGIYILRLQLRYREELEANIKWATATGVFVFLFVELFILRQWMGGRSGFHIFTTLGLMLSTAALYGHLFVSIASQIVVDMIHPPDKHESHHPDFAPAEALEEIGDFNGALNEYLVIGRIFPRDPDPVLRLADIYLHLDETHKAIKYFSKGLSLIHEPERALRITNRISGIYTQTLDQPEEAKKVLYNFMERFSDADECASVQRRLDSMNKTKDEEPEVFHSTTGMLEPPPNDLLG